MNPWTTRRADALPLAFGLTAMNSITNWRIMTTVQRAGPLDSWHRWTLGGGLIRILWRVMQIVVKPARCEPEGFRTSEKAQNDL